MLLRNIGQFTILFREVKGAELLIEFNEIVVKFYSIFIALDFQSIHCVHSLLLQTYIPRTSTLITKTKPPA